jgi:DNA-binding CsgD family transcriptional regulator
LVAVVQGWPLDDFLSATVERLQGRIAAAVSGGHAAPPLLLNAAKRFEALDRALARETYLEALSAAMFAGPLVEHEVAKTAWTVRAAPASPASPRAADLLLDGFALQITEGARAACPSLRQALTVFEREDVSMADELRWLWLASLAAVALWDDVAWHELARRQVQLAREQGALTLLPLALNLRIVVDVHQGRLSEAASLSEEVRAIAAATRTHLTPYGSLALAAWRGEETDATRLIDANLEDAAARGEGIGVIVAWWARAVLFNGLGRYDEACAAAELAAVHTEVPGASNWVLAELVEAAARSGRTKIAVDALHRLSHLTVPVGTDWALGVEARCRALLADGDGAEGLYREAIDRLGRSRIRPELARAYLLYGEWLRRENRRLDARDQLRAASRLFTSMGTEAFAERAARELLATGETARKRTLETGDQLTPQETQIARLASDGLSNPEIGTRMFLSPRTIEYHLHKIFGKLGVKSRAQLSRALSIANAERLIPYSGAQLD